MNFQAVLAQLSDLPPAFRRQGAPYTQLLDSLAGTCWLPCLGIDGMAAQVSSFQSAQGGWLDAWGLLFLVPRYQNEGDGPYRARISETVLAWVATVPALQAWLDLFAPGGTVAENASGLGYAVTLPPTLSSAQVALFIASLNRIRPAGVPFTVQQAAGGLFTGTEAFFGIGRVQGAYLTEDTTQADLDLAALTNSAQPLLPSLFLTDPVVNGTA